MNQFTWHPELLSSEGLANFLQEFPAQAEDTTLEEFTKALALIKPLLTKAQLVSLLKTWCVARGKSGKITQEEANQVFDLIATRIPPDQMLRQWLEARGSKLSKEEAGKLLSLMKEKLKKQGTE